VQYGGCIAEISQIVERVAIELLDHVLIELQKKRFI
jgi:hypothetical protein